MPAGRPQHTHDPRTVRRQSVSVSVGGLPDGCVKRAGDWSPTLDVTYGRVTYNGMSCHIRMSHMDILCHIWIFYVTYACHIVKLYVT
jgi:hypothetical protein